MSTFDSVLKKLDDNEIEVTLKFTPKTKKEKDDILKSIGKSLTKTLKNQQSDYSRYRKLLALKVIVQYLKKNKGYNPNVDGILNTLAINLLLKEYDFFSKKSKTI